jgi:DMSO reductase anchor subunit
MAPSVHSYFYTQNSIDKQRIFWAVRTQERVPPVALASLYGLQWVGLMAERWSFFAEGQHTKNLYAGGPR